jgi:hypothetical protein
MDNVMIRGFEIIFAAFLVSGMATTIYNIVTFREQSDRIVRRGGIRRIG